MLHTSSSQTTSASPAKPKLDLADRLELGSRLRKLREATGKSTLEIAEEVLGYTGSHAAVSRLERGVFAVVNMDHLRRLADFYGTTTEALLHGTGDVETADLPEVTGAWAFEDIKPGLPARLRDLRQALGLSKLRLAEALGHAPGNGTLVRQWESGQVTPRPDTLMQIATTLGVSASWLILGAKGKARAATQSMRVRALRHLNGLSRPELAMKADPMDFSGMRSSIAGAETEKTPLMPARLVMLAKAFDVPVSFLDPQGLRFNEAEAERVLATSAAQAIPSQLQKLVGNLVAMFEASLLDLSDLSNINKLLSQTAWGRATPAAGAQQNKPAVPTKLPRHAPQARTTGLRRGRPRLSSTAAA